MIITNFKDLDYPKILAQRISKLVEIRKNQEYLAALKVYYRTNPAQFITDWGCTIDPRNALVGKPSIVPFILFPKQIEWVEWLMERYHNSEPGVTEKSRQIGASWLAVAVSTTLCLFNKNLTIGFGSRKLEYVDKIGDPKSLFEKSRQFLRLIPYDFLDGWDEKKHSKLGNITFPGTDSVMTGESGDQMGRGGASTIYFVDEAAFIERAELVERALSQNSPVRIYMSTPNGQNNVFYHKRHAGETSVFTYHWRDDPRKDEGWYEKTKKDVGDPIIIAQELDLDYSASIEGVLIPSAWIQAAVDAHIKLNITPRGIKRAGFDVADEGRDLNALCVAHGIVLFHAEDWRGTKTGDIYASVEKVFNLADDFGCSLVRYDGDGLGAGVRGDARVINEKRKDAGLLELDFLPFLGAGEIVNQNEEIVPGRTADSFFKNAKSESWWAVRRRFQNTYRAIEDGMDFDPDELISIDGNIKNLGKLKVELGQVLYKKNDIGMIIINKTPKGMKSPNLADALMMCYAVQKTQQVGFFDA